VLDHTLADLDGDFGGSGGAVLPAGSRDAAYIPLSVTSRDKSLEPCSSDHIRAIASWRVSFSSWAGPAQVPNVGTVVFCEGRFRVGAVKPYEGGARLTTPMLPALPSP
jgi:hypothetical protein